MNDTEKNLAELFVAQMDLYYSNFDRRRVYEWKLSLGIWTALAAFIALTFEGKIVLPSTPLLLVAVLLGLLLSTHAFFLIMVTNANDIDKGKAHFCEEQLIKITKANYLADEKISKALTSARKFGYWSVAVHLAIDLILLSSILMMFVTARNAPESVDIPVNSNLSANP